MKKLNLMLGACSALALTFSVECAVAQTSGTTPAAQNAEAPAEITVDVPAGSAPVTYTVGGKTVTIAAGKSGTIPGDASGISIPAGVSLTTFNPTGKSGGSKTAVFNVSSPIKIDGGLSKSAVKAISGQLALSSFTNVKANGASTVIKVDSDGGITKTTTDSNGKTTTSPISTTPKVASSVLAQATSSAQNTAQSVVAAASSQTDK